MDREEKGILKENREGKGFSIIPYPCPPYRAAPIYGHVCAHACPIAAPIYGHVCAHACPIAASLLPPYMAHICPYIWHMYVRMYTPLNGTKIRTIRKAVKKRQALCLIWTSLLALAIHSLWGQEWAIYKSSNGPYMGAGMGPIQE